MLIPQEIKDPQKVLEEFFLHYTPEECHQELWHWFRLTISGEFGNLEINQRSDLISFYENLQGVLEAVHALHLEKNTQ